MTTLVIDSATEACSVALFDGDVLIAGDCRVLGRGHAEHLIPMIAALPGKGRADRIAVALGPGSFTGVRVGLAAARALAFAWGAELVGYPTLALIAAMAGKEHAGEAVTVCTTGGHGEWFVQDFDVDGLPLAPLASLTPAFAVRHGGAERVAGSQAEALVAARGSGVARPLWPDARHFAALDPNMLTADTAPLYGRAPDARLPGAA
ncbi:MULTISPECIES: tRNA (adenosine(37)-N6)-threonylcarbamoyltransferase complex dimerization subunit type 1 TsaB [unclassified Novosphingobium]|uniref:tRNA (adenosine(37)-N6)-threonylcarbamoyltransferase complex dimerization subunit type 1 TsaB n=1 Tax=unclassified Novosphingobium TaxID=2644732 RepID=UPI000ED8525B|nr:MULTISPECIES: tRNA (adenosine(37)-N6)-threonylcarbamoyltransferase complex dimerization subunit type 1 TsaB [unclassified Novosphingobium]HCF24301.1 tRNA (adenosine(37)-N6)-threonylcarbamoyltransferase complex dimerization subunit type 1 TsaB [Novosphingobium sp.]HQV04881.1 tRNA (adenosine(37)-N6)-threonylcarbamoyltransferase complex dimerization subunit type 1 TsaB [Novosphingobium sp.]